MKLTLALLVIMPTTAFCAQINDTQAIKAIIGEAEGEGYSGKEAVGCAIYGRGNLKGVYGLNSPRVKLHKYSKSTYLEAKKAWFTVKTDYIEVCDKYNFPTGWGNAHDMTVFNKTKWFSGCGVVAKVGSHYFYSCEN